MPLEKRCLTGRWCGHSTGENGERQIDVVVVAARRDMLGGSDGRAEPGGPAPGRDRPLGLRRWSVRSPASRTSRSTPASYVDAPAAGDDAGERDIAGQAADEAATGDRAAADNGAGAPVLQPRRRHQPRGGPRRDLPLHADLAVRRGGDRAEARRAPRADPRARAPVARPRRPREAGRARSMATPRRSQPRATRSAEGAARLVDELRLSLEYYAAQEGAVPVESVVACGPGTTIPGLTRAPAARPRTAVRDRAARRPWPTSTARPPPA